MQHLLTLGYGYTAKALAHRLLRGNEPWRVTGSSRRGEGIAAIEADGVTGIVWNTDAHDDQLATALQSASHLLISVAPSANGDPVIDAIARTTSELSHLRWIGYLSTTGVYGDCDGAWVDETTPVRPASARAHNRVAAENAWLAFGTAHGVSVDIFRLAGIYGPGRSAFDRLRGPNARRIIKPDQVFNRIHVEDIAATLEAAMLPAERAESRIFNVADDLPAPPQYVIEEAARLLGVDPPPEIAFQDAQLSEMARSFYSENKRISNRRLRDVLSVQLSHPTYREGLAAIFAGMASNAN